MTLAEFLEARFAEDEAYAAYLQRQQEGNTTWAPPWTVTAPARMLADVEAKRRIVKAYQYLVSDPELRMQAWTFALRCLAEPYAKHPDYRPDWKP